MVFAKVTLNVSLGYRMRKILHPILWVLSGGAFFFSTFYMIFTCNLFSWDPLSWDALLFLITTLLCIAFMGWLAIKTKFLPAIIVSFVVSIIFIWIGCLYFSEFCKEELSWGFLGRKALSPWWFRILILILFLTPSILWSCFPLRYMINKKKS